jgi:Tol biopolymer transport system component
MQLHRSLTSILAGALLAISIVAGASADESSAKESAGRIHYEGERHLANVRQLTFGGQNAEAYFSADGTQLILQSTHGALQCDAIFRMDVDGTRMRMVSTGKGVTTCSFIAPDDRSIIYSSTHLAGPACPPKPDYSRGYVWPLYEGYDVFRGGPKGENLERLTDAPRYDAEAVYSPQGDRIVFTSLRTGDLELFMMQPDGSGLEQLTDQPGYDGGAFFSRDGKWIVWRASRPRGQALEDYQALLAENLVRPSNLEIYIMSLADRKPIQLTDNGAANFGPYWHPDGRRIIFASNLADPEGRNFDLYLIDVETRAIERVTHYAGFDGFPMFSYDGTKLVFASNRNGKVRGETNVFIADWQE